MRPARSIHLYYHPSLSLKWDDAPTCVFAQAGIPGVVMGPGSIQRAHTAREFVEVDQVDAMTDFFIALLEGA